MAPNSNNSVVWPTPLTPLPKRTPMQVMLKHLLPFVPAVSSFAVFAGVFPSLFAPRVFRFGDVSNVVLMCERYFHADKCACMLSCCQYAVFILLPATTLSMQCVCALAMSTIVQFQCVIPVCHFEPESCPLTQSQLTRRSV